MNDKVNNKVSIPQVQEIRYIYMPGQPVKNLSVGYDYKIILGSIREVVFNFDIKNVKEISVEVEKISSSTNVKDYGVYDVKKKKILSNGKFLLEPNKPYRVHVSRFFKGTFIVKADGKIIGRYTPKLIDTKRYGKDPLLWIEPMYIGFSEADNKTSSSLMKLLESHNNSAQEWLSNLPQFNNQSIRPPYSPQSIGYNFLNVCRAPTNDYAMVFVYKPNHNSKISWRIVMEETADGVSEVSIGSLETMLNPKDFNELVKNIINTLTTPESAATLNGIAFIKDNRHWKDALNRKVKIKWVRGYLAIVFKGHNPPFDFTHAGLAHDKLKGMSGGVHVRKNRIWLSFKNAHTVQSVTKGIRGIPALALVLDLIGDYKAVMVDENGSREIMELLGRAGISTVAAGVGVVAGSAALFAVVKTFSLGFISATPVGVVLLVGLIAVAAVGYYISDKSSQIKGNIWG